MSLNELESKSIYVIRDAYNKFGRYMALLWSTGKDSTTLIHLFKKAFFGKVPFPVIYIDTSFKFKEMYEFRDRYVKEWNLNLVIARNEEAIKKGINYNDYDIATCCHELKTKALQKAVDRYRLKALMVGIRRDEHGVRNKERYFSHRDKEFRWDYLNQPAEVWDLFITEDKESGHFRVHPLLHWTELDVWGYIKKEGIPVNPLYFANNGKRYRSLGCEPITKAIDSNASNVNEIIGELSNTKTEERAGRDVDKEENMQKLRALGYM